MYSSPNEYTTGMKAAALALGFMEDFVCTTYFVCLLWLFDVSKQVIGDRFESNRSKRNCVVIQTAGNIATFVVSWLLFLVMMIPFVSDLLLVVNRDMRFTFDLVTMAINEREFASAAPISVEEIHRGYVGGTVLVIVSIVFATVRTKANWADLSTWNPTHVVIKAVGCRACSFKEVYNKTSKKVKYVEVALEEGANQRKDTKSEAFQKSIYHHALRVAIVFMGLVGIPAVVVALRCACSPLVAYCAMNTTLNEMFGHALQPTSTDDTLSVLGGWIETFIHPSEKHERFGVNTLYRRSIGFQGDLAFDVNVSSDNPPNVLVIGVESFRFQDSRYLVGDKDPSNLFKGTNMTITPKFDKWAKRGVALRNIWSSSPTSRSLESLLFAQVPYDSTVKTAITGGRKNTNLSGLPQLFKAKGYETFFTTGCPTRFENWDVFLPSHGYETLWDSKDMMKLAERDYGIRHSDWHEGTHRGFKWGVHDDINLQLLGDLLVNKTNAQIQRMAKGEPKKPLFTTHYTISSHSPFEERPKWYANANKPDFSPLYKGEKQAGMIKNYLEMRYFADIELGKFMGRMEKEGILNDTIVVIVGDHGQAPEAEVTNTHEESVTRVAGAIIAEGRLGNAAGLIIEDAVEQYDILNTLADITGLPEGGFVQNGIGRSLKRKVPFGERVVFSNDPSRKMSIVRGHRRLRYDQVTASMMLHDTENDHAMTRDLFPGLSAEERAEWEYWRDHGRHVTAYYTKRWDENCLLAVSCTKGN
ncbi:hypothetical protein F441_08808 [Phytophthora nicotianae CJ01A1]|uniref:Sulfatase N-terminal domain-containing protein n=2 Tax=Phytophthora nicotianae TaxID=4792 RepID=W2X3Z3_PHYNI|nr:hypothetical protein F441_08808 [Phytophthora nicotianae CJ01A1]